MYRFKNNNKGFTLAELLIVIAIIAALVAIMIPTFGGQIEKAREAADIANLRSAYAEASAKYLSGQTDEGTDNKVTIKNISITQTTSGWSDTNATANLPFTGISNVQKGVYSATFTFSDSDTTKPEIALSATSGGGGGGQGGGGQGGGGD